MSRRPTKFQRLKQLSDEMKALTEKGDYDSPKYNELLEKFRKIKSTMPKYHPHIWRLHGL